MTDDLFNLDLPIDLTKIPVYVAVFKQGIPLNVGPNEQPFDAWLHEHLKTTVDRLHNSFNGRTNGHFNEDLFTI